MMMMMNLIRCECIFIISIVKDMFIYVFQIICMNKKKKKNQSFTTHAQQKARAINSNCDR